MINKRIIAPLLIMILVAGFSGVLAAKRMTEERAKSNITAETMAQSGESKVSEPNTDQASQMSSNGRYESYAEDKAYSSQYNTTILFFHAGWCPECRSFKKSITSGQIPDGTQVLEVDYDSSASLKKQHGVTLQSTFVKVDNTGNQISKWIGYGKEKSLQAVLANL